MAKNQVEKVEAEEVLQTSTALVKKDQSVVALSSGEEVNFFEDAGHGLEGTTAADYAIPFLAVLQGLSPAVADGLVEGAKPGLLMNSVTQELAERVKVIPCAYARRFIEWAPREKGGGFMGEHLPIDVETGKVASEERVDHQGITRLYRKGTDNQLKDTRTHYCLALRDDGSYTPVVVSMASTQIKRSKRWLAVINDAKMRGPNGEQFTPPSYARVYELSSEKEENAKGKWHSFAISSAGVVPNKELYNAAKDFHKMVLAGAVKVQHDDSEVAPASETDEERAAGGF